tara:strand:+ start:321 stop:890 length:570 start_codon:yes stop_codon:yes gene_type:complete
MASTREDDMMRMQRMLDPGSVAREGEIPMSIEIDGQTRMMTPSEIARLDLPMRESTGSALTPQELQSDIGRRTGAAMTDIEKVQMLMDMGLDQRTAIEAVAMEKDMPPVDPRQFSGQQPAPQPMPQQMQPQQMANPGMGSLSGVPSGMERPMVMPTPRPEDLMMRQMPSGRDRTYNPRDAINPYNAPNT